MRGTRRGRLAPSRSAPLAQSSRRAYHIVGGPFVQGPGCGLVAVLREQENDRWVANLGRAFHQLVSVFPGQRQVQQDQIGPVLLDRAGHRQRTLGNGREQARLLESMRDVPVHLRVVVHDPHVCPLLHRGCRVPRATRRRAVRGLSGAKFSETATQKLAKHLAG